MAPFLSLIVLFTCAVITSTALSNRQEQTLALEQRREILKQRLQQLEQSNYNDILANRVAAYHLDQQRRLLRAKLKLKRGLQSQTSAYPGIIKHYGVHPMGFRYFVGYQRPLSSRYLPPTGSINKPPYNYFPEQRPSSAARPTSHYGPPQPPAEVHPIDTPSVPPPQPPELEIPRPIVNTAQAPASRPDVIIQTDGSGQNPTVQVNQPQNPTVQVRPIQPVFPQPPVVLPQPNPPPTIIIQQRPQPSPPNVPNAFPVQPIQPQPPVFSYQPLPNLVPVQPQPTLHLHPVTNAFPLQPVPQFHLQQVPNHLFPVQQNPPPVHLHPVSNAVPIQPVPALRPALPVPPQPIFPAQPAQPPVIRVPSITLKPVNPILRPVLQTNIPVGTTLTVAPAGPPNLIPKTNLLPLPLPPPNGVKIFPGNAVETSYSATFPKVQFIQNVPQGLWPLPTGPNGQFLPNSIPNGQPIPIFPNQPPHLIPNHPQPLIPNHPPHLILNHLQPLIPNHQQHLIPNHPPHLIPNHLQPLIPNHQQHLIPNHPPHLIPAQGGIVPIQPQQIPVVPNGHIPASIHPPNFSLEPPYIKRIDKN